MRLVNSSHLGGLRDRDHPGLHMVRIVNAVVGVVDRFNRKLPILGGNRNEFAAGDVSPARRTRPYKCGRLRRRSQHGKVM